MSYSDKSCNNCKYVGVRPSSYPCVCCSDYQYWKPEPYKQRLDNIDISSLYPRTMINYTYGAYGQYGPIGKLPKIQKVIFNDPATIVFWSDKTKTVVKAQDGDIFDPEKGLAMAISKKALGNGYDYYNKFKKWLPKEE